LKRAAAILLCFTLILALFACQPEGKKISKNDDPLTSAAIPLDSKGDLKSGAVVMIDGVPVSSEEFYYQLSATLSAYEYYNGASIDWNGDIDGVSASEFFLEQALASVTLFRAVEYGAKLMGVELGAEELAVLAQDLAAQIEDMGGEEAFDAQLALEGISREIYEYFYTVPELYYKLFEALYIAGEGIYAVGDAELREYYETNYMTTQHIVVMLFDEEGYSLSEAEIDAAWTRMEQAHALVTGGGNFAEIMLEYGEEDWGEDTKISFTFDEMPTEYVAKVLEMKPGEISEIFTVEDAYCIVKRLELDMDFFEVQKPDLLEGYAFSLFEKQLAQWTAELNIEKQPLYSEIDVHEVYHAYGGTGHDHEH